MRLRLEKPAVRVDHPESFFHEEPLGLGIHCRPSLFGGSHRFIVIFWSKAICSNFSVGKNERAKIASLRLHFDAKFRANSLITLYQLQLKKATLFQAVI